MGFRTPVVAHVLQVPDVITHHAASSYPFAGWSVKTSEKDSSASIDSIGANLFRHNMISCINVCTYHIECISRNVIKPAFQGVVGRSRSDEVK